MPGIRNPHRIRITVDFVRLGTRGMACGLPALVGEGAYHLRFGTYSSSWLRKLLRQQSGEVRVLHAQEQTTRTPSRVFQVEQNQLYAGNIGPLPGIYRFPELLYCLGLVG